jgi:hypothetical protein
MGKPQPRNFGSMYDQVSQKTGNITGRDAAEMLPIETAPDGFGENIDNRTPNDGDNPKFASDISFAKGTDVRSTYQKPEGSSSDPFSGMGPQ